MVQNFKISDLAMAKFEKVNNEPMEQHALKNVNNCMDRNIYSYLETSGGESVNAYLNVVHFLNTRAD
jgi:hypothetical protein